MHRLTRPIPVAFIAMLLLATPASAASGFAHDSKGPACTNIIPSDGVNTSDGSFDTATQTVSFQLVLAASSCTDVTYTLYVLDEENSATATVSWQFGSGASNLVQFIDVPVSSTDGDVCVYATTGKGSKLYDRAPDATPKDPTDVECVVITDQGSGGGSRMG
jgi:hypothetical protein